MDDSEQIRILGVCLEAIAAGETRAACLARYPERAGELEPMLAAADELRRLDSYSLTASARQRAKARLRQAQAVRSCRPSAVGLWLRLGSRPAARAWVGVALALVCLALSGGIVAASHPGDLAYGVRVTVERVPASLVPGSQGQAEAELGLAMRRLAELRESLDEPAEHLDPRTVAALLASDERAADLAAGLPAAEQAAIGSRLTEQARSLEQLSQTGRQAQDAEYLRGAAVRVSQAARHASPGVLPPSARPTGSALPESTKTAEPGGHRHVTPGPTPADAPTGSPVPNAAEAPHATASLAPAPVATTLLPALPAGTRWAQPTEGLQRIATALPAVTSQGTPRTQTTEGPQRMATALPAATPQGSNPASNPPGPGPAATSPGPDPAATSHGPDPAGGAAGPRQGQAPGPRH